MKSFKDREGENALGSIQISGSGRAAVAAGRLWAEQVDGARWRDVFSLIFYFAVN